MNCKDCKLFDIEAVKDKAGRVRKSKYAKCLWISTEQYPISLSYDHVRPVARYVAASDGERCPCFQKREN